MVDGPRQDEQQIRQAVDVADEHGIDGRIERDNSALRPAADGAREMQRGPNWRPAGKNEAFERR